MGYTRYWTMNRELTAREWARLMQCVEPIQRLAGVDLAGPLGFGAPVVTFSRIAFNGAMQTREDYETFELTRRMEGRGFCKTEHRPYDSVVAAVLTAADRLAPGAFTEVSADGGPEDWAEADAICDYIGLPRRKRIASRASVMTKAMDCSVVYTGSGVFDVTSPSGSTYTVAVAPDEGAEHWECSCPWGQYGGALCSHTRAVEVWLDHETMALDGASQAAYVAMEEAA